jgi:hypothetical protein
MPARDGRGRAAGETGIGALSLVTLGYLQMINTSRMA